jgi:hypothetical protein
MLAMTILGACLVHLVHQVVNLSGCFQFPCAVSHTADIAKLPGCWELRFSIADGMQTKQRRSALRQSCSLLREV